MWFKQAVVYALPARFDLSAAELADALAAKPLEPCGAYDARRSGWVGPAIQPSGPADLVPRVHAVAGQWLIALGSEEKLLPTSIIRQETADRAALLESEQGHPPSKRQVRDLRDRVADELLARAFVRRTRQYAWIDPARRRLVLDTCVPAKAEALLSALRDAVTTFDAPPLATHTSPRAAMTRWLERGSADGGFTIDADLTLRAIADVKHLIRYANHPLDDNEVRSHLKAGLAPLQLGLTWRDRLAFQLGESLQLRRIQFVGMSADGGADGELDPEERFDADFALMTGELGKLLDDLVTVLGGIAE